MFPGCEVALVYGAEDRHLNLGFGEIDVLGEDVEDKVDGEAADVEAEWR